MSARKDPKRADDMVARRQRGETLESIGESYGVSRQRVLQIVQSRVRELRASATKRQ